MGKLFYNSDYIISLNPLHFFPALTILDDDSTKGFINSFKAHSIFLPQYLCLSMEMNLYRSQYLLLHMAVCPCNRPYSEACLG